MINRRDLLIKSAAGLSVGSLPAAAQEHNHVGHNMMEHDAAQKNINVIGCCC